MLTNRILTLRRQAALTQQKLSQKTLINQGSISQMERGAKPVTIDHLFVLASALDCLPSEFVNDEAYLEMLDQPRNDQFSRSATISEPRLLIRETA